MVSAIINISDHANRILNIVKAKYSLRDKSEAINVVTQIYEEDVLEPELRPAYAKKLKSIIKNEKRVAVKNFRKEYGLE
jgi:hypothetical protein